MKTVKPKILKKGDTIGIISLCGAVSDPQKIYNTQNYFENMGYKTVLSENIFDKKRYLAGDDLKKIKCLEEFFQNPEIDGILCSRGGYGAIRIVDKINYDVIKNNPKIFAGYSDVTALSLMMLKRANLVTFSAPMACSDFGAEEVCEFTADNFFRTLTCDKKHIIEPEKKLVYKAGTAKGILFGGNLATVVSLCGIDFIPDEKFIFFAEDLNEDVYKIDKMFNQLLNIEKFRNNVAGVMLGEFLDVTSDKDLDEFFEEFAQRIKKPVMGGFKITHGQEKITVPTGAEGVLDTSAGTVCVERYMRAV